MSSPYDATEKLMGLSDNIWITISYNEVKTDPKPPIDGFSRTTESFNIEAHSSDPGERTNMILLEQIEIGEEYTEPIGPVQKATLRLGGAVSLVSISITPTNPNVQEEGTIPLTATGTRSDSSYINLTNTAEWSSSDYEIASVSENGVVTGIGEGTAVITASLMLL